MKLIYDTLCQISRYQEFV